MNRRRVVHLLLLAGLLAGCVRLSMYIGPREARLLMEARYGELVHHMEDKISSLEEAPIHQLSFLCEGYAKTKSYTKLFECADALEKRIDGGERIGTWGLAGFNWDYRPAANMLRAEALIDLGDYREAIRQSRRAYDRAKKIEPKALEEVNVNRRHYQVLSLTYLGLAHALAGERNLARKVRDALDLITMPKLKYDHWIKSNRNTGVCKIHFALGEYHQALEVIDSYRGEKIQDNFAMNVLALEGLVPGNLDHLFLYVDLPRKYMRCKALLETGQVKQARAGIDALLKVPGVSTNGDLYWLLLVDRGRIAEQERDHDRAISLYRKAVDVIESQRASINTEASKIGFVRDKQVVYSRLIGLLFARKRLAEAFNYVERSKARALVDLLASRKKLSLAGGSRQTERLLTDLEREESRGRVQDETGGAKRAKTRGIVLKLRRRIKRQAPRLADLVTVDPPGTREIQRMLGGDETLVEYYGAGRSYFAFIVTRSTVKGVRLDGRGLAADVESFRATVRDHKTDRYLASAMKLYGRVFAPLRRHIKTENVIIVAHGPLHHLPFGALLSGEQYLIDELGLRHLPSAAVLRFLRGGGERGERSILALGNPDAGAKVESLAGAQAEATAIARIWRRSRLLLRARATETDVKRHGARFDMIHFASHAEFDSRDPLDRSGLRLARDNKNDGFLSVGEVYGLKLRAQLVSLSACETGLGKISDGDEIVGFVRAFLYAGADSILSSLWKVPDDATRDLMVRFYEKLKTLGKREALREAQREVKEQERYRHPFHWAGFQLTGAR